MTPENASIDYSKRDDKLFDDGAVPTIVERVPLTAEEEKALKKIYLKLDCFFLSLITILYWLNFLDRGGYRARPRKGRG